MRELLAFAPANGIIFTPTEMPRHALSVKHERVAMTKLIRHWIGKGYVEVTENHCHKLVRQYEKNGFLRWAFALPSASSFVASEPVSAMIESGAGPVVTSILALTLLVPHRCSDTLDKTGHPPLLSIDDIPKLVERNLAVSGQLLTRKAVAVTLKNQSQKQSAICGYSSVGLGSPSKKTVMRYMRLVEATPGMSQFSDPVHKTMNRYLAETSLLSAVTFAMTALEAAFIPGTRTQSYAPLLAISSGAMMN